VHKILMILSRPGQPGCQGCKSIAGARLVHHPVISSAATPCAWCTCIHAPSKQPHGGGAVIVIVIFVVIAVVVVTTSCCWWRRWPCSCCRCVRGLPV